MEQPLPILISLGLPESLFVRGHTLPAGEKKIVVFALKTSLKFMRNIARPFSQLKVHTAANP
jgi:hypothetical protein